MSWSNWSGKIEAKPVEILQPSGEAEVAAAVRRAAGEGRRIRCVGAAHSHAPLAVTEGTLLDLVSFDGVIEVDSKHRKIVFGDETL